MYINSLGQYYSYLIAFLSILSRYYDYSLFGLSAGIISNTLMPYINKTDQLLSFFFIFSLSVCSKPIGSIIFGYIGDKIGRVIVIRFTTILGVFTSSAIAFIPSYNEIGIWAVILLTLCRILFLISFSAEVDAIKIYVSEKVNDKYRNLVNCITVFFTQIGVLLAAFMYHFTSCYNNKFIGVSFYWRINFIFGGILGVIVMFLQLSTIKKIAIFEESSLFLSSKNKVFKKNNLLSIIKNNYLQVSIAILCYGFLGGIYHFLIIFFNNFLENVLMLELINKSSYINLILIGFYSCSCLSAGLLFNKYQSKKDKIIIITLLLSIILTIFIPYILYNKLYIFILQILLVSLCPFYSIITQIQIQRLFSTNYRMRLFSLSHSLGSMILSSTTPLCCMLLWKYTKLLNNVVYYLLFQLIALALCLLFINRQAKTNAFK